MKAWQIIEEHVDFKHFEDLSMHPKKILVAHPSQAIVWSVSQGCLLDAFLPKFEDYLLASLYFAEVPEKLAEIEWENEDKIAAVDLIVVDVMSPPSFHVKWLVIFPYTLPQL